MITTLWKQIKPKVSVQCLPQIQALITNEISGHIFIFKWPAQHWHGEKTIHSYKPDPGIN